MIDLKIVLMEMDGDMYMYTDVTSLEIKDNKIEVVYDENNTANHLVSYTDEIRITSNR